MAALWMGFYVMMLWPLFDCSFSAFFPPAAQLVTATTHGGTFQQHSQTSHFLEHCTFPWKALIFVASLKAKCHPLFIYQPKPNAEILWQIEMFKTPLPCWFEWSDSDTKVAFLDDLKATIWSLKCTIQKGIDLSGRVNFSQSSGDTKATLNRPLSYGGHYCLVPWLYPSHIVHTIQYQSHHPIRKPHFGFP